MDKEYLIQLTRNLYYLTLLFPKKEPLRYKIRELADEILAEIVSEPNSNEEILKKLEILDSFFEIVKTQNWVSQEDILLLQAEYSKVKENLASFSNEPKINDCLNKRQKKILEVLRKKERVQVWEIKRIFSEVSKRTLRRDFEKFVRQGLIERLGEGNSTFYKMK